MTILVDSQPYTPSGPPEQTVQQLALEVCQTLGDPNQRMVVALSCEGQAVADGDLEEVLRSPTNSFGRLEFQTQPTAALVRVTLDQTIRAFEDFPALGQQTADMLEEGRHDQAMHELQRLCDLFKQSQQALVFAAQALRLDLDDLRVNNMPLTAILDRVKEPLAQLKQAMETGDLVLVADTLRYELAEPTEHWLALLQHLRDQAATNAH